MPHKSGPYFVWLSRIVSVLLVFTGVYAITIALDRAAPVYLDWDVFCGRDNQVILAYSAVLLRFSLYLLASAGFCFSMNFLRLSDVIKLRVMATLVTAGCIATIVCSRTVASLKPRLAASDFRSSEQTRASLCAAVSRGDLAAVKDYLSRGVNPNAFDVTSKHDSDCPNTLLLDAIFSHQREMVKLLIHRGASVSKFGDVFSPIEAAAEVEDIEIAKVLLDCGADVNSKTLTGPALTIAAGKGDGPLVRMLLHRGADRRLKSVNGLSARQMAIEEGHPEVAHLLD